MIRFYSTVAIIFNLAGFIPVQTEQTKNAVTFTVRNAGIEINGSLGGIQATIQFDPDELDRSSIIASANVETINTGINIRDKHLKKADYFDVAHFPRIRLQSKQFGKTGKNKFEGKFELTIKGITKEIIIPFHLLKKDNINYITGKFKINRLDFRLGEKSNLLHEIVEVHLIGRVQN